MIMSTPQIVVGFLSGDMVHADFSVSMAQMACHAMQQPSSYRVRAFLNHKCSVIHGGRNNLVREILDAEPLKDVTHLLMVDSDMTFPPMLIDRMLSHGKPVVGIDAVTRRFPVRRLAHKVDGKQHVGAGILLIQLEVFRKVALPWFEAPYVDGKLIAEDYNFCRKVWDAGLEVHCDDELSKYVGHLGTVPFTLGMVK